MTLEEELDATLVKLRDIGTDTSAAKEELTRILKAMHERGDTQEELARRVGKNQSWISRRLSS